MARLQVSRALGLAAGALVTPLLFPFFLVRGRRFFHTTGLLHMAHVVPPPGVLPGAPADLASRLVGPALVRFSGGLFSKDECRDSLGLGLRFHCQPLPTAIYCKGDQDLTLITAPSFFPAKLLDAMKQTDGRDFLANTYHGVWPYEAAGLGRVSLRITPSGAGAPGKDRAERLENAVARGAARLLLEVAPAGSDLYLPVAELRIGARLSPALEETFRLHAGSGGRGLQPAGFWHAVRVVPYVASQHARKLARSRRLRRGGGTADAPTLPRLPLSDAA
ncbi:hypothetical protein [Pyxidicoccus xibeiensis]|uniref:hypothetical protein n=1 Tax=Pyxidicoccus xibeiensis TaxID=2906759 RepID=UPI0020A76E44|nr:hypothetical protein [Pyxidicoccus xibeiensis]MCP3142482.1 hypothetical protein [Pyxidicoccus xibeiensis]